MTTIGNFNVKYRSLNTIDLSDLWNTLTIYSSTGTTILRVNQEYVNNITGGIATFTDINAVNGYFQNISYMTGIVLVDENVNNLYVSNAFTGINCYITNENVNNSIVSNLTGINCYFVNENVNNLIVNNFTGINCYITNEHVSNSNISNLTVNNLTGINCYLVNENVNNSIVSNLTGINCYFSNEHVNNSSMINLNVNNLTGINSYFTNSNISNLIVNNFTGINCYFSNENVNNLIVNNLTGINCYINTLSYNNLTGVSFTGDIQLLSTSSGISNIRINQSANIRYVNLQAGASGIMSGYGTAYEPYMDLNYAYSQITDASYNNQYTFILFNGPYLQTSNTTVLNMKPNINLFSYEPIQINSYQNIISSAVNNNDSVSLTYLTFFHVLEWGTNSALTGTVNTLTFNLYNCNIETNLDFSNTNLSNLGVSLNCYDCTVAGVTVNSPVYDFCYFYDCELVGASFGDCQVGYMIFLGGINELPMTFNGNQNVYFAGFIQDTVNGSPSLTFNTTSNGTPTVLTDSMGLNCPISGSRTVTYLDEAHYCGYTPSNSAAWNSKYGTVPSTVGQALDLLVS